MLACLVTDISVNVVLDRGGYFPAIVICTSFSGEVRRSV